jgi:hypothetical protein
MRRINGWARCSVRGQLACGLTINGLLRELATTRFDRSRVASTSTTQPPTVLEPFLTALEVPALIVGFTTVGGGPPFEYFFPRDDQDLALLAIRGVDPNGEVEDRCQPFIEPQILPAGVMTPIDLPYDDDDRRVSVLDFFPRGATNSAVEIAGRGNWPALRRGG